MPASTLQITAHTHANLATIAKNGDTSFPKTYYSPGKMPVTVYQSSDITALGAGWFPYPVCE
jgi:hypothetical protein